MLTKFPEIAEAQAAHVGGVVPVMGQRLRHGRPPLQKEPETGRNVGEVRKADNDLAADAQRFVNDIINLRHLLHALVQDDVIEGFIGILHEAAFDIAVEDAQPLFNALVDCLVVKLDPLHLGILVADQVVEQIAAAAAQIQNAGAGFDDLVDNLVVKTQGLSRHQNLSPRNH